MLECVAVIAHILAFSLCMSYCHNGLICDRWNVDESPIDISLNQPLSAMDLSGKK